MIASRALALAASLALVTALGCSAPSGGEAPPRSSAGAGEAAPPAPAELAAAPDPFAPAEDTPPGALADAPDPFAAPPGPAELADAPDPFASPAPPDSARLAGVGSVALAAPEFAPALVDPRGDPSGFQVHGRANLTGALTNSGESVELLDDDSLELSSVDLYLEWFPLHWFGAMAEGELDSELDERERKVEAELELAVLELRPLGDPRIRLRLGHAPVPFGLERRYYAPPRNELANRPAAFRRVYPGTYSDVGGFLWIDWPLRWGGSRIELEAALTKGLDGPTRDDKPPVFAKDRNAAAQFAGRIALTLFQVEPTPGLGVRLPARLTFGASLLAGHYDKEARRRIRFYGLDAELWLGGLRVRAEYVRSVIEREQRGQSSQHGIGVYAQVAYHWFPQVFLIEELFLAFRYGRIDPDEDLREAEDVETYHLGGGWSPYRGVLAKAGFQIGYGARETERVVFLEVGYSF